jgi:Fe2+ or Zn2+ uptake regulation protein
MTSGRRTRQLAAVYEVVCASHDHPSADDVFQRVRRHLPHVSLGTVYRNLQKLTALRRLRTVYTAQRVVRYDAMVSEHDHFVCEICAAVSDLSGGVEARDHQALERDGYRVRAEVRTLYGICPRCAAGPFTDGSTAGIAGQGSSVSHAGKG